MSAKYGQIYFYDWDQEIREFKTSGMNMCEFCRTKDYTYSAFSYHYYKRKKEALQTGEDSKPVVFAQVIPSAAEPCKRAEPHYMCNDSNICINGLNIAVTENTSMTVLKKVLKAMEEL